MILMKTNQFDPAFHEFRDNFERADHQTYWAKISNFQRFLFLRYEGYKRGGKTLWDQEPL